MYGKPCHFLVELDHKEYWAINQCNMDIDAAGKQRKLQLNELEEIRNDTFRDKMISRKDFSFRQKVLFYSCFKLFLGKFRSR